MIPPITPTRKMLPMSDATPAITITVTAWPIAVGSASISWNVFTSACIAPTIRCPRLAMHPPPPGAWVGSRPG